MKKAFSDAYKAGLTKDTKERNAFIDEVLADYVSKHPEDKLVGYSEKALKKALQARKKALEQYKRELVDKDDDLVSIEDTLAKEFGLMMIEILQKESGRTFSPEEKEERRQYYKTQTDNRTLTEMISYIENVLVRHCTYDTRYEYQDNIKDSSVQKRYAIFLLNRFNKNVQVEKLESRISQLEFANKGLNYVLKYEEHNEELLKTLQAKRQSKDAISQEDKIMKSMRRLIKDTDFKLTGLTDTTLPAFLDYLMTLGSFRGTDETKLLSTDIKNKKQNRDDTKQVVDELEQQYKNVLRYLTIRSDELPKIENTIKITLERLYKIQRKSNKVN